MSDSEVFPALTGTQRRPGDGVPEAVRRIWELRAKQLARVPEQQQDGEQIDQVWVRLGAEVYGLDARWVVEIRPAELITPVPRVPAWVAGVVNNRGHIYSAVDLAGFLGLPPAGGEAGTLTPANSRTAASPTRYLVFAETPELEVALQVDDVLAVEPVPVSLIHAAEGTAGRLQPEYVRGMVQCAAGAGPAVILDLRALLADERIIVREEGF